MLSKRKSSFTRNMAILVCVAFISVITPEVTHAAASSLNDGSSSSQNSFPISSSVLSNTGLAISLIAYKIFYKYVLSGNDSSLNQSLSKLNKYVGNSSRNPARISDNSDSNKKPKDKD